MQIKAKNGSRVLHCKVQTRKEATGNAAGRKTLALCVYSVIGEDGKETVESEWIAFWNGDPAKGQPMLSDEIKKIPLGTWIVAEVKDGKTESAALQMLTEAGMMTIAGGTPNEISIIAGKPAKTEMKDNGGTAECSVAIPVIKTEKVWYQATFASSKQNPALPDEIERLISGNDGDSIFVCSKPTAYADKKNAFTCRGYMAVRWNKPENDLTKDRLPEDREAEETVQAAEPDDDPEITIGIHAQDKPKLSSLLLSEDGKEWLRSVIKWYKPTNDAEKALMAKISQALH